MRRYIKYAKLQGTDAFLPGVGALGTTLPPVSKTLVGFQMFIDSDFPNFITVELKGHSALIPLTNVQIAEFSPVTSEQVKSIIPRSDQSLAV